MYKKSEKWVYLLIGFGSGIVISGIVMIILALTYTHQWSERENTYALKEQSLQETIIKSQEEKEEENKTSGVIIPTQNLESQQEEVLYKSVTIPNHYGSTQIAAILEEEGIIDDAETFNAYLLSEGQTRSLRTGEKVFPIQGQYDQILQILLTNNNK